MRRSWLVGGLVAVAAVVVIAVLLFRGRPAPPAAPPPPAPTPAPTPTPEPSPFSGVKLEGSDEAVRQAAEGLTESPLWAKWLAQEDLVRRFVASVNLVAQGKSPRSQLAFLRPRKPFTVVRRNGRLFASPESYRRYDAVVSVLTSVDPEKAAALYRQMRPLFDAAYREISAPGASFDELMARAVQHLLDTPIPQQDQPLEEKVVTYRYADPALESLTDAQRQLLRLGPDNARAVQDWLGRFLQALAASGAAGAP